MAYLTTILILFFTIWVRSEVSSASSVSCKTGTITFHYNPGLTYSTRRTITFGVHAVFKNCQVGATKEDVTINFPEIILEDSVCGAAQTSNYQAVIKYSSSKKTSGVFLQPHSTSSKIVLSGTIQTGVYVNEKVTLNFNKKTTNKKGSCQSDGGLTQENAQATLTVG
ncbi:unnamed protein product [Didymodactylos carnosus]|uniref:ZP domain-containing protein n=1 Tax=Didymodactylos carnosus TaxID=1234261 RepID=A0A8S2VKB2_9BILA|nr:unnamed protein product [Didymodactylos carnosus]CAF4375136.1 unnamed protein product [Didymodactylos carnosus]